MDYSDDTRKELSELIRANADAISLRLERQSARDRGYILNCML